MKKVIFLVMAIVMMGWMQTAAQDDPFDPIIDAIRSSDARSLSASFNTTLELCLPDNENTFSSSQAEMIMKDFFRKYPPDQVEVIQKGTTGADASFAICSYSSASINYQVYIQLRKEKDRHLINKIKFEEKKS
ncbi:MAG: DUF4783 domain-containing protein [Bacteroidales bacterium]|jgi:hypothetical protein|nr:DUF4783 domain-containing protein [Bacteroidales bacterium]